MYLLTQLRNYYKEPLTGDTGGAISAWITEDWIALRIGAVMVDLSSNDGATIRQNVDEALDTLE